MSDSLQEMDSLSEGKAHTLLDLYYKTADSQHPDPCPGLPPPNFLPSPSHPLSRAPRHNADQFYGVSGIALQEMHVCQP